MKKTEQDPKQKENPEDKAAADLAGEAVTPFNSEEIRLKLEKASEEHQSEEMRKERLKLTLRAVMAVVLVALVAVLAIWAGKVYQNSRKERALALTAEALANKYQAAESFMIAGRPEEALNLYKDILTVDPSYRDVPQQLKAAEQSVHAMELYQQGVQELGKEQLDEALKNFLQVEELRPDYKDTAELIKKIKQQQQVKSLLQDIDAAYAKQDWAGVIHSYEAIQEIDPLTDTSNLKHVLFTSYRNLIIDLSERSTMSLDDINTAERYYRKALALVPQDKTYTKEREELKKIAIERLANKYYLHAVNLIESTNYSAKGLRDALSVLSKADSINADSPILKVEIEKTKLFLDSYDNLLNFKWDGAITGFETLRRKDENYADGRVKYFLYEAYTARGDMFLNYADFEGALSDYKEAEKFVWAEQAPLLPRFQIQIRIANALEKVDSVDQSAELYNYAFNKLLVYQDRLTAADAKDLLNILDQANAAYQAGDKLNAIGFYQDAMKQQEKFYTQITVAANQGDTLASIAFQNGSTIEQLRNANHISEDMIVAKDQDLIVPVLVTTGK